MLIRMPTAEIYALKTPIEHKFLPMLKPYLSAAIPIPLKIGLPSKLYPFHFSIYKWLDGESLNHVSLDDVDLEQLAYAIANFLNELHDIDTAEGLPPGLHNHWRGAHISVYDHQTRPQITKLSDTINSKKALKLWDTAMITQWNRSPVWIHGDMAAGNIVLQQKKLSGIIDFGGMAIGDPASDLVIAWTLFNASSKKIFKEALNFDDNTWLRAKAWALWKSTYELCKVKDHTLNHAKKHYQIITAILNDFPN